MNKLYRFTYDCGRFGRLEGTFVQDDANIAKIIGRTIYFGEVLGKHSDVDCTVTEDMFEVLTDDQDFIEKFQELGCWSGYDPFDYSWEDEDEEDESDDDEYYEDDEEEE